MPTVPRLSLLVCYLLVAVAYAVEARRTTAAEPTQADAARPNVIVIFTDDQGYQDLGCFGSPDIATPNLDRMATEGMKFTDFYVNAPICSASRAALLTGCYCQRVSITGVLFPRNRNGLNPSEITIADMLKARGYATACIGKWHLGHLPDFLPGEQGFDMYYGIPYSNDMTIDPKMAIADDCVFRQGMTLEKLRSEKPKRNWVPLMRDGKVIEYPADQRTLTRRYTEQAIEFITQHQDQPFFVYLPHTMPHIPLFVPEDRAGKSKRGLYGDVIEEIDWSVGQILNTLKQLDIDENTLVIYTSDNGPWLSFKKHGGTAKPLRDGKFSTYEGGMRVPCIMRWPGKIPAGKTCSEIAATIDLLPTIAAISGAKVPADRIIDGHDIQPLLQGTAGAKSPHEAYYFYRGNNLQAVRAGKWKLHLATGKRKQIALYDLASDIGESKNIAEAHPEVVERLSELADAFHASLQKNKRPAGQVK